MTGTRAGRRVGQKKVGPQQKRQERDRRQVHGCKVETRGNRHIRACFYVVLESALAVGVGRVIRVYHSEWTSVVGVIVTLCLAVLAARATDRRGGRRQQRAHEAQDPQHVPDHRLAHSKKNQKKRSRRLSERLGKPFDSML